MATVSLSAELAALTVCLPLPLSAAVGAAVAVTDASVVLGFFFFFSRPTEGSARRIPRHRH
jgi:hypothetical protein